MARAYVPLQNQQLCGVHEILDRQVHALQHLHLCDHKELPLLLPTLKPQTTVTMVLTGLDEGI